MAGDRFARDLAVQLTGHALLQARGIDASVIELPPGGQAKFAVRILTREL